MGNILYLEKRGCDFSGHDDIKNYSNVGNYRVVTTGYNIAGIDRNNYFIEFTRCDKRRFTNKRTGKPLKKFIIEHSHKLHVSTAFNTDSGCYGNLDLDQKIYDCDFDYTLEDILKAVNMISVNKFDSIEFIN